MWPLQEPSTPGHLPFLPWPMIPKLLKPSPGSLRNSESLEKIFHYPSLLSRGSLHLALLLFPEDIAPPQPPLLAATPLLTGLAPLDLEGWCPASPSLLTVYTPGVFEPQVTRWEHPYVFLFCHLPALGLAPETLKMIAPGSMSLFPTLLRPSFLMISTPTQMILPKLASQFISSHSVLLPSPLPWLLTSTDIFQSHH